MNPIRGRVAPVLIAATLLVGGANLAAYASSGHPLILGGSNKEVATTTVKNLKKGPAFSFTTSPKYPPFTVSSGVKVTKLNADELDGLSSAALQTRGYRFRLTASTAAAQQSFVVPVPTGIYQASFAVFANTTSSGDAVNCGFSSDGKFEGATYGVPDASTSSTSASVLLDTHGNPVTLVCFNSSGFTIGVSSTLGLSSVSLVRVDTLHTGTSTPVTTMAGRGRSGFDR